MTANPITQHRLAATACDGSIFSFLKTRGALFKYSGGKGGDLLETYRLLARIATSCSANQKDDVEKLLKEVDSLAISHDTAVRHLQEAELCMEALETALTKISDELSADIERREKAEL